MTRLKLTEEASKNLAPRGTAVRPFDHAAFRDGEVEMDFAGVESMGRAFAHEHLVLKSRCPHGATGVNAPYCVKMPGIVRDAGPRAGHLTKKDLLEEPMPLMIDA